MMKNVRVNYWPGDEGGGSRDSYRRALDPARSLLTRVGAYILTVIMGC